MEAKNWFRILDETADEDEIPNAVMFLEGIYTVATISKEKKEQNLLNTVERQISFQIQQREFRRRQDA